MDQLKGYFAPFGMNGSNQFFKSFNHIVVMYAGLIFHRTAIGYDVAITGYY